MRSPPSADFDVKEKGKTGDEAPNSCAIFVAVGMSPADERYSEKLLDTSENDVT